VCKSQRDGGQRCAAHTRPRLDAATRALHAAAASGDPGRIAAAHQGWEEAAVEYASTPEGRDHFAALAGQSAESGDYDTEALLNVIVRRGQDLNAANKDAGSILAAAQIAAAQARPNTSATAAPLATSFTLDEAVRDAQACAAAYGTAADAVEAAATLWEQEMDAIAENTVRHQYSVVIRGKFQDLTREDLRARLAKFREGSAEAVTALTSLDAAVRDPSTSDDELAHRIRESAEAVEAMPGQIVEVRPNWVMGNRYTDPYDFGSRVNKSALRDGVAKASDALAKTGDVPNSLYRAALEHAEFALDHPRAGDETWAVVRKVAHGDPKGLGVRVRNDPRYPVADLVTAARSADSLDKGSWGRVLEASYQSHDAALAVALAHPDSDQRQAAAQRIIVANPDSFTPEGRLRLATNLGSIPGSVTEQREVAKGVLRWAKSYGDAGDRVSLAQAVRRHYDGADGYGVPSDPGMVRIADLLINGGTFAESDFDQPKPQKKGWFAGR
jgi:hypothetical protein